MRINHIGLWVSDLEKMKQFYQTYFQVKPSALYHNPKTGFSSYFLTFETGARLEIMHRNDVNYSLTKEVLGLAHFAISLGSKEAVNSLTKQLTQDGYTLLSQARLTGDGYYESVVADPEDNRIELTI